MVCLTFLGSCLESAPTSVGRRRRERNKRLKSKFWHILQLHQGFDFDAEVMVEKTLRCQIDQVVQSVECKFEGVAQSVECKFERVERSVRELQAIFENFVTELQAQKIEIKVDLGNRLPHQEVGRHPQVLGQELQGQGLCDVTDEYVDGSEDGMEDYALQRNRRWPFLENRDVLQYACCSTGAWENYLGEARWCMGRDAGSWKHYLRADRWCMGRDARIEELRSGQ